MSSRSCVGPYICKSDVKLSSIHQFELVKNYVFFSLISEDLFIGFLTFYEKFDFANHGISIVSGLTVDKPPDTPTYVVNPIEKQLNVCKNITEDEINNFKEKCHSSLQILETNKSRNGKSWGLLAFQKDEDDIRFSMNISDILKDNTDSNSSQTSSTESDSSGNSNDVSDQVLSQTNAKSS